MLERQERQETNPAVLVAQDPFAYATGASLCEETRADRVMDGAGGLKTEVRNLMTDSNVVQMYQ